MSLTDNGLNELFLEIADAIRYSDESSTRIYPYDMPDRIMKLSGFDAYEMADLYNTGCDESALNEVTENFTLSDTQNLKTCQFKIETSYNTIRLYQVDFSDLTSPIEFLFENLDFSQLTHGAIKILDVDASNASQDVVFHFKNCKIPYLNYSYQDSDEFYPHIKFLIENCDFNKIGIDGAGEAIIKRCKIINTNSDAVNVQTNAFLDRCYIQVNSESSGTTEHTDALQFWGHNSNAKFTLRLKDCRFVNPKLYSNVSTNAALMIQPERSSLRELILQNVSVIGGGYICYVNPKNGNEIDNVFCSNMKYGCYSVYGSLYPSQNWHTTDALKWDYSAQNTLIIGSVFIDDNNKVNVVVSNDTNQQRTLKTVLSNGTTNTFTIPKCITYEEKTSSTTIADFPWNLVKDAGASSGVTWVACYDSTSGEDVLISKRKLTAPVPYLTSITATKTTTRYNINDTLSTSDIVVNGVYSDGSTSVITNYSIDASNVVMSTEGTYSIIVSYIEDGTTYTTTIQIIVINASQQPTLVKSFAGKRIHNGTLTNKTESTVYCYQIVGGNSYKISSDGTTTYDIAEGTDTTGSGLTMIDEAKYSNDINITTSDSASYLYVASYVSIEPTVTTEILIYSANSLQCTGSPDPGSDFGTDVTFKGSKHYVYEFDYEITTANNPTTYTLRNRVDSGAFDLNRPWVVGSTGHINTEITRVSTQDVLSKPFRCRCDSGEFGVLLTNIKVYEVV